MPVLSQMRFLDDVVEAELEQSVHMRIPLAHHIGNPSTDLISSAMMSATVSSCVEKVNNMIHVEGHVALLYRYRLRLS